MDMWNAFLCLSPLITFVEKKYPHIIFDPFLPRFRLYQDRRKSKLYYAKQNSRFDESKSDPQKVTELARRWYPHADISVECSIEMQLTQYAQLRELPVVDAAKLTDEEKAAFDAVDLGKGVLSQAELLAHRLPEMPASLVPVIEEIWLNEVVGK